MLQFIELKHLVKLSAPPMQLTGWLAGSVYLFFRTLACWLSNLTSGWLERVKLERRSDSRELIRFAIDLHEPSQFAAVSSLVQYCRPMLATGGCATLAVPAKGVVEATKQAGKQVRRRKRSKSRVVCGEKAIGSACYRIHDSSGNYHFSSEREKQQTRNAHGSANDAIIAD